MITQDMCGPCVQKQRKEHSEAEHARGPRYRSNSDGDGPRSRSRSTARGSKPSTDGSSLLQTTVTPVQHAKQGRFAAANYQQENRSINDTSGVRLVSHAVQDDTMRCKYLPRVRQWLEFVQETKMPFNTTEDIDFSLSKFLDDSCFGEELSFSWCAELWNGVLAIFPELGHQLPVAYRAYKAWERRNIPGEGEGIPEEAVFLIADGLRKDGKTEAALIAETSMDVYFRVGEWAQLRGSDIVDDGEKIAIIMGVASRGERVKTGRNQGVIIDSEVLRAEWRALKKNTLPGDRVFSISPDVFRDQWRAMKRKLGLEWIGPPHDLRHSGAARDVEMGTRSLEQVRRRGRWRIIDSVQRYTKTWLLVRSRERMTNAQRASGLAIKAKRGARTISE